MVNTVNSQAAAYKSLPSVDKILQSTLLDSLVRQVGSESVKLEARSQLERIRRQIADKDQDTLNRVASKQFFDELCEAVRDAVDGAFAGSLVPVINLTGTVVHTNLGRARLPREAVTAMSVAAICPTNLEYDLQSGKRGDRDTHLEASLCDITGAEAATLVNNNAAAVLLVLNTLAREREVLISRGELVEIGGAFRIPDVMQSAHCVLKEVGTTNRTHLRDYESGISDHTGLIMKVHTSNYEIRGFTNSVAEAELGELAHHHGLPFVSDLGSGTLVDLRQYDLPYEPTVTEALATGADLVTFSGDKLLGGPQAGIIVGKSDLIKRIKRNPLKRALRVDKITLAALSEVINLYKDPRRLQERLPLLADLTRPLSEIERLAEALLPALQRVLGAIATASVEPCKSQIGSGALPLDLLASRAIVITPVAVRGRTDATLNRLARAFRSLPTPVIGRIHDGSLIFDLRCLRDRAGFERQLDKLRL